MIVTTGNEIAGYEITGYLGVVRGIVVRSTNIAQNMIGGFKQILGGNISEYQEVCEKAREEAYELLIRHASEHGADAIIGMRYDATEFNEQASEVLAYGTAVKVQKKA